MRLARFLIIYDQAEKQGVLNGEVPIGGGQSIFRQMLARVQGRQHQQSKQWQHRQDWTHCTCKSDDLQFLCSSSFFFLNIDKTNLLVYIGCGQSGMVFEQWVLVYCCSFFSNNVALNQAITIYYSSSKPNDQPNLCFLF